jgi:polygalacturonase
MKKNCYWLLIGLILNAFSSLNAQNRFLITDFGAKGDGASLNTTFIQKAIDKAGESGGTVVVPAGVFITATLFLKSNITLELASNATIKGSEKLADYLPFQATNHHDHYPYHLIVAFKLENVRISGMGILDGSGPAFWEERPTKWHFYPPKKGRVSPMLEFFGCKNLVFQDIRIQNSPGWTLHLNQSEQVNISGIQIENSLYGPNSDGIDINGCKNVSISNCKITCGDDAIVLKTTKGSAPCEYVVVSNCILETHCVAMKLGTESHNDFRHIQFNNVMVKNASRVISLICNDGGTMENVQVNQVTASTNTGWILNRVIEINANKRTAESRAGKIKNVRISNLIVETDGRALIGAANGSSVEDIWVSDIHFQFRLLDDPLPMKDKTEGDVFYFRSLPDLRGARSMIAAENVSRLYVKEITAQFPVYPISTEWKLLQADAQT